MTREELAISLKYKNEEEWDRKLDDPEYRKYLFIRIKIIGLCYKYGNKAYDGQRNDKGFYEEISKIK